MSSPSAGSISSQVTPPSGTVATRSKPAPAPAERKRPVAVPSQTRSGSAGSTFTTKTVSPKIAFGSAVVRRQLRPPSSERRNWSSASQTRGPRALLHVRVGGIPARRLGLADAGGRPGEGVLDRPRLAAVTERVRAAPAHPAVLGAPDTGLRPGVGVGTHVGHHHDHVRVDGIALDAGEEDGEEPPALADPPAHPAVVGAADAADVLRQIEPPRVGDRPGRALEMLLLVADRRVRPRAQHRQLLRRADVEHPPPEPCRRRRRRLGSRGARTPRMASTVTMKPARRRAAGVAGGHGDRLGQRASRSGCRRGRSRGRSLAPAPATS